MAHQKLKRTTTQPIEVVSPTLYPGDVGFKSAATLAARQQSFGNFLSNLFFFEKNSIC